MKKNILFYVAISLTTFVSAQSNVSIYFAQTLSTFRYTDSKGNSDPNMRFQSKSSYGVNYTKVFRSGFFIRPEIGFRNAGAASDLYTQKVDWALHYLDFNFGIGYGKRFGPVSPYVGFAPYVAYLYSATQTVGSEQYNLLTDKGIKKSDLGFNLFGGVKYKLSQAVSIVGEVRNITGLKQLETNAETGKNQKLYNQAFSFQVGISFNLVNKKTTKIRGNF
jgi:hypothetical protein